MRNKTNGKEKDVNGINELLYTSSNGSINIVKLVIEAVSDFNHARTTDGSTLLIMASQTGHTRRSCYSF